MERIKSTMIRAAAAGIVVLLFCAVAHQFNHAAALAAEPSGELPKWEYAELAFVGILPDAYSSCADYRDPIWRWSSSADGGLRREGCVTALREIHNALTGYPPASSIEDGQLLLVLLLDAIGAKGWELAGYDEQGIPVNYAGLFHAGNQVTRTWIFKRLVPSP